MKTSCVDHEDAALESVRFCCCVSRLVILHTSKIDDYKFTGHAFRKKIAE